MANYYVQYWDGLKMHTDTEALNIQQAQDVLTAVLPMFKERTKTVKRTGIGYTELAVWESANGEPYDNAILHAHSNDCEIVRDSIRKTITLKETIN